MGGERWTWSQEATIQGDAARGRYVVDELLRRLEDAGWCEEDIFGIHMAAEEALANAIKHGNNNDASKTVELELRQADDLVRIVVVDEGAGFNPEEVPDPTEPEYIDRPCGRGVLLMRQFMTRVDFSDQGNRVVMEKDRSRPSAECG